jgi:hypothetical protein
MKMKTKRMMKMRMKMTTEQHQKRRRRMNIRRDLQIARIGRSPVRDADEAAFGRVC